MDEKSQGGNCLHCQYWGHFKEFKDRTIWDGCSYIGEHYSVIFVSQKAFYFVTCLKMHLVTCLIMQLNQVGNKLQLGTKPLLLLTTSYHFISL